MSARFLHHRQLPLVLGLALALVSSRARAETVDIPDVTPTFGTWLWVKSEGLVATSNPETKGVSRSLVVNPDLTYELHQRRAATDTVLCRGIANYSEETAQGYTSRYLDFQGWHEPYERRMSVDFEGPDTLLLLGARCENCPQHTYVRGRTALFEGTLKAGQPFRRDLWDGLRFELVPEEHGWEIAIRDTTRPGEDLASLTPPYHFTPNPTDIEGWHFRNKANTGPNRGDVNAPQEAREFIFSPEVGKAIAPASSAEVTAEMVDRVTARGRGAVEILELVLTPPGKGQQAGILSMRFRAAIEESGPSRPESRPAPNRASGARPGVRG